MMEDSDGQKSPKRLRLSISSDSSIDRLSDLPDPIVQHILSFLPAKDAIKFCTLSKQWDSLWTSIPSLLFCYESRKLEDFHRFACFVDRVLRIYALPKLHKFSLEFRYDDSGCSTEKKVVSWIRFAKSHKVEELCLDFKSEYSERGILYDNRFVTKMRLTNLYLDYPGRTLKVCWTALKVLFLAEICLDGGMIRSILVGSPLLEHFTLCQCRFTNIDTGDKCMIDSTGISLKELVIDSCIICQIRVPIEIKCPTLLSLTIVGEMAIKTLKLVDVSSLLEADLDFGLRHSGGVGKDLGRYKRMLKGLLYKLRHVNKLAIGIQSLQVISIMKMDHELSGTNSKRKILKANIKLNKEYLPGLAALLKSSPDLEQLTIDIMPSDDSESELAGFFKNDYSEENYWRSELSTVKCLFRNLKSVNLVGFTAVACSSLEKVIIELVQVLLANARVLQKLIIHGGAIDSLEKSWTSLKPEELSRLLELSQKLLCCSRASPNAVVVFENYPN